MSAIVSHRKNVRVKHRNKSYIIANLLINKKTKHILEWRGKIWLQNDMLQNCECAISDRRNLKILILTLQ